MNWLLTAVLCVLLVELALRLPFAPVLIAMSRTGAKAAHVVRARAISDHWKEKAMGAYARTTFGLTMKLAGLLVALLAVAVGLVVVFNKARTGFEQFILGWAGIGASLVFASLYWKLRQSMVDGRI